MNPVQRKADWTRTAALLKSRSFDVKFDLENTDYKRVETIGTGAYGVVCSALNKKDGKRVAIKKIPGVFDIHVNAMRTYREIKILRHFNHDNIISIQEILKPKECVDSFKDIYVVLDLMESDLHRIIHSNQDLTDEHIRYFLYQLLRGVKYIHSANVIHRDLKPSNLLVNEDCQLKIGDFGMARGTSSSGEEKNMFMTQYVATRWYRSPEIMLSMSKYTSAVDIWSVGCIFAEMLGRKHLFPGKDSLNQLKLIIGVLGSPSQAFLDLIHLDVIKNFIKEWGHKDPLPLVTLFPGANRKALDLLSKMLTLHPKERLTAEQALKHPYLSKYHDPDDEPICIPAFNFDFEKRHDLKGAKLREAIVQEIYSYHQSAPLTAPFNAVLKPVPLGQNSREAKAEGQGQTTGLQAFLNQLNQKQTNSNSSNRGQGQKVPIPNILKGQLNYDQNVVKADQEFKVPNQTVASSSLRVEGPKDVKTLNLPSSRDVEMLSAKSMDGKQDITVTNKAPSGGTTDSTSDPLACTKDNTKLENKTISADTKATLKAALLNARKQRAENGGSDRLEQNKKVTALSRQKERMQKRKEKAERAKRKEKLKEKSAGQQGIELSAADKELLQRWKVMQENRPPRPSSKDRSTVTEAAADPQVTDKVSSDQTAEVPSRTNRDSQGSLPSPLQQQNQQIVNSGQCGQQTFVQVQANVISNTVPSTGYQQGQGIFYRVDSSGKKQPELRKSFPLDALSSMTFTESHVTDSQGHQTDQNFQFNSNAEISHNTPQGNVSIVKENRGHNFMQKRNSTGSAVLSQESAQKDNSGTWRESSENKQFSSHRCSDPVLPGYCSSAQGSPQTSQSEAGSTPSQGLSPLALFEDYTTSMSTSDSGYLFNNSPLQPPFQQETSQFVALGTSPAENLDHCPVPMFGGQGSNKNNQPLPTNTTQNSSQLKLPAEKSPPQLKINPSVQEVTDQDMPSANRQQPTSPGTGRCSLRVQTSLPSNPTSTADWVSLLSRQLSQYKVEDIYPPALVGTPKGTGGGYGLGLSLDQEMQEGCSNPDSAPLSASLLADWMDVSGNMSARELEAFMRESELTSPMALSYSDLNLSS